VCSARRDTPLRKLAAIHQVETQLHRSPAFGASFALVNYCVRQQFLKGIHMQNPVRSDDDVIPMPTRARIEAEARRARKARAQDGKIIRKLIEQLGVSHNQRANADADFGEAKAQAAQWLRQLRARSRPQKA
jgi:hypothetical protein